MRLNVLFLTIGNVSNLSESGVYTDLIREFRDRGDNVFVVCPLERRRGGRTALVLEEGVPVLRVRTTNLTQVNLLEKGISTLLIEHWFTRAIKEHLSNVRFDLVLYASPPVTLEKVVRHVKSRDGCTSYLMLKDIFPQNAVDLGVLRVGGLIWRYFRMIEKRLYSVSDHIGCMSRANVEYLLRHNPELPREKVEECPNSIRPSPLRDLSDARPEIRDRYSIPREDVVFVFGGNLGRPQGIDFLLEVLDRANGMEGVFFIIAGSGTEFARIQKHLRAGKHKNARLMSSLPSSEYRTFLSACDVGLILLDARFTIPNFPSRLTAYMDAAMPILAATDSATDLGSVLTESGSGLHVRTGDLDGFMAAVETLAGDPVLRREMGLRGRRYLEAHYTVSRTYEIITRHLRERD